jgi:Rrf2 family protein
LTGREYTTKIIINTGAVQYIFKGGADLQFNQGTDYAFRVILYLASLSPGEVVNGQNIAQEQKIPAGFLQKIMRALCKGGLVKSFRGMDGGFQLVMPAERISLLDVITIMEGPVNLQRCLEERESCTKYCGRQCPVHEALGQIQSELVQHLAAVNFSKLAEKYRRESEEKR